MTKTQAYELGRSTQLTGGRNLPFANTEMMAELENAKVGEKVHLLKAFNQGWHDANLDALVS